MTTEGRGGIIRTVKTGGYTVLDNTASLDERLSYKAVGLHTYLMTRPDHWQMYASHLATIHKDGLESVLSGLRELEQAGYLERRVIRDEKGRIIGRENVVYEKPTTTAQTEKTPKAPKHTKSDLPYMGKPVTREIRNTENPYYGKSPASNYLLKINTDLKQNTELEANTETPLAANAARLDTPQKFEGQTTTPKAPGVVSEPTTVTIQASQKNQATSPKKVPGGGAAQKPVKEPTEFQRLFEAVAVACLGDTEGLTNVARGRVGKAAKSLMTAGYNAEEVPKIAVWIRHKDPWRTDLTPETLEGAAPKWRAQTKPQVGQTAPPSVDSLDRQMKRRANPTDPAYDPRFDPSHPEYDPNFVLAEYKRASLTGGPK